ncbi:MAG: M20 family metallopeptidase [Proteobacteria bacterium]|nr:M20 family metallopeptidase [Pseudomonadota bacterium]
MSAERNAIELTRDLLRFDTINPTGDETACARYLGDLLADAGFRVSYYPYGERRTCVVAALGGSSGKRPLCITGHIDTVPLGAARWRSDPFAGESDGDRLFGRGSSDMKSGVAAFVVAALAFAGRLAGTAGIELVITGGEESGCEGAFHLARSHALGHAAAMLVAEPTANYPLVAHKGAFWLEARTHGVTAHGSMPERGDNAVFKAARAALALEHFEFGIPAHPLLGQPTLNVGTFHGGLNINSVPDFASIGIDIRTIPGQDHAALRERLSERLGAGVELHTKLDVVSVHTDPHDPWVAEVFDVMKPILGEAPQPRAAPYFTDAPALRPACGDPPTVVLGPGEPQMAHQTDEYCVAERIREAAAGYEEIIRRWCAT